MKSIYFTIIWLSFSFCSMLPFHTNGQSGLNAQNKNYSFKRDKAPLLAVMTDIEDTFGITFNYQDKDIRNARPVTVNCTTLSFQELLDCIFADQDVSPYPKDNYWFLRSKKNNKSMVRPDSSSEQDISGIVFDEENRPIQDVTIAIGNVPKTKTTINGEFRVVTTMDAKEMIITCKGYEDRIIPLPCKPRQNIRLKIFVKPLDVNYFNYSPLAPPFGSIPDPKLDGTIVIGINDLLQGSTVPGLFGHNENGSPKSSATLVIRGDSRIFDGILGSDYQLNGPLIILDKMPIPNILINQFEYMGGNPNLIGRQKGGVPLNRLISPDNIASMEILKDAAFTAMYGAKGGNGVIIINSKKGTANTPQLSVNGSAGIGISRNFYNYLNAQQYEQVRRQGLKNDSITPNKENAPDLHWKGGSNTNFNDLASGGTVSIVKGSISTGGITNKMNYFVSADYYKETSPIQTDQLGKDQFDRDIHVQGRIQNLSMNGKLSIGLIGNYYSGKIRSLGNDFTKIRLFAPTAPSLVDSLGKLNWGLGIKNPLSYRLNTYQSNIDNVVCHFEAGYQVDSNLTLKSRLGIILLQNNETVVIPKEGQDPSKNPTGSTEFGNTSFKNTRAELIAEYRRKIGKLGTTTLVGFTIDRQTRESNRLLAAGYTSDLQLYDRNAGTPIEVSDDANEYGYVGTWLNSQLEYRKKYELNFTLRRDGSSSFGDEKKYGLFWAIGTGYVLSKAPFLKLPDVITYAKLRASYGISGNDQIGDYGSRNFYRVMTAGNLYGNQPTIQPYHHLDENFSWEEKRQLEIAGDFILNNKITVTGAYYDNTSTKLLISKSLPNFTGFGTTITNSSAKVRNSGFELSIQKRGKESKPIWWNFAFSLTIPKSKVIKFPDLAQSSYANTLRINEPVSVQLGFLSKGFNPATGYHEFVDLNKDGTLDAKDYVILGDLDPNFYGGFRTEIGIKKFVLGISLEFVGQKGINQLYMYSPMLFPQDGFSNVPVQFLNYWKQPGDQGVYQKPTANQGTDGAGNWSLQKNSQDFLVNANFLRFKNMSLTYPISELFAKKSAKYSAKLIFSADNAFLLTKYKGADPGSQNFSGLAPLKRFLFGFQFNLK